MIEWRKIKRLNLFVSDTGLVRIQKKDTHGYKNSGGYFQLAIRVDGTKRSFKVHRLVLEAFAGQSNLEVNHKNGIKTDNRLENLEYVTRSENIRHAYKNGLNPHHRLGARKLSEQDVAYIRAHYIKGKGGNISALAKKYGVVNNTIYSAACGPNWKTLKIGGEK